MNERLRNEVLRGLECVVTDNRIGNCEGCKYLNEAHHNEAIMRDAYVLLKMQEPKVMTLEEVQTLRANDVVWLEDKGKPNIIPGIVRNRHLWPHSVTMVTNFMRGDGCKVTADDDDYGKRWRCWTSRPTDEQRKAVKWDA